MALLKPIPRSTVPGVTDDSSKGFYIGAIIVNTVTKIAYICTDVTVGAAVWNVLGAAALFVSTSGYPYDSTSVINATSTPALFATSNGTIGGP